MDNFRNELVTDIESMKEDTSYLGQANNRQINEVLALVTQMAGHHGDSLAQPIAHIIESSFKDYSALLVSLEMKDL